MYQDESIMLKDELLKEQACCPCGSGDQFAQCCYPIWQVPSNAATPEQLMRSRYTAFCLKEVNHLVNTHHISRRAADEREALHAQFNEQPATEWLGLEIIEACAQYVTFIAKYRKGAGQPKGLYERSRFIKDEGTFFYLDGEIKQNPQPERNAPCWCNSGKKAKKCCFK